MKQFFKMLWTQESYFRGVMQSLGGFLLPMLVTPWPGTQEEWVARLAISAGGGAAGWATAPGRPPNPHDKPKPDPIAKPIP